MPRKQACLTPCKQGEEVGGPARAKRRGRSAGNAAFGTLLPAMLCSSSVCLPPPLRRQGRVGEGSSGRQRDRVPRQPPPSLPLQAGGGVNAVRAFGRLRDNAAP
ncbi:hypothetical protein GCM10007167_09980 [Vulcaniibacterium thermophilum]|uniref:Uncharacterized protein n=1 Tax=Vulcaniibacterium thermophilum TaxID=1169913 RepID=A0A918YZR3_9GAMM|nr:hypothetical protein GCM10007167_09980 [Vulcaniibacterium thermophilum]